MDEHKYLFADEVANECVEKLVTRIKAGKEIFNTIVKVISSYERIRSILQDKLHPEYDLTSNDILMKEKIEKILPDDRCVICPALCDGSPAHAYAVKLGREYGRAKWILNEISAIISEIKSSQRTDRIKHQFKPPSGMSWIWMREWYVLRNDFYESLMQVLEYMGYQILLDKDTFENCSVIEVMIPQVPMMVDTST